MLHLNIPAFCNVLKSLAIVFSTAQTLQNHFNLEVHSAYLLFLFFPRYNFLFNYSNFFRHYLRPLVQQVIPYCFLCHFLLDFKHPFCGLRFLSLGLKMVTGRFPFFNVVQPHLLPSVCFYAGVNV
ncbi:hypothetical protein CW304_03105 [Bacillus sp. UFRGS-B20]|nr:hypothetical protein CW304_03105 [Bacillus sp. UFRGS-B20]